jgi:hypothetical protein
MRIEFGALITGLYTMIGRDDERAFDGHIAGSMHFSSGSFEEKLPKLVEEVKNKETVVFHCSFSQVCFLFQKES